MSIEGRLAELERKHKALEIELEEAEKHPSSDSTRISEMKREKLKLKEEISRLNG